MGSVVGRISEETPAYEVLATGDNFEVRRYAAGTAVEASDANNQAFGALAKYIGVMSKPQNARSEAISMTAPVVSIPDDGAMRMQFVLPSAIKDAPEPTAAVDLAAPEPTARTAPRVAAAVAPHRPLPRQPARRR